MTMVALRLRHAAGDALLHALTWGCRTLDHWTGWCRFVGHHPVWTGSVVACSQCGRRLGSRS
jgi:hypothetical protein